MVKFLRPIIALGCLLAPSTVSGARLTFKPKLYSYFGETQINLKYKKKKDEKANKAQLENTMEWRESLRLGSSWFIYHPRFLKIDTMGTMGLTQIQKQTDDSESQTYSSVEEYDIYGVFLPKHFYNLSFFTNREMPLFTKGYSGSEIAEEANSGVSFFYIKRPWNGKMLYRLREIEGKVPRTNDIYITGLRYFDPVYGWNLDYNRNINETVITSTQDFLSGGGFLKHKAVDFLTSWSLTESDSDAFLTKGASFNDRLTVNLPWNFTSKFQVEQRRNRFTQDVGTNQEDTSYDGNENYKFELDHKLFESVTSKLLIHDRIRDSTSGGEESLRYELNSKYQKKTPLQGVFTLSGATADNETDRGVQSQGELGPFTFESDCDPAASPVCAEFTLRHSDADINTIKVELWDSDNTTQLDDELDVDSEYAIDTADNVITIYDINPVAVTSPGEVEYSFRVTYRLMEGDFKLTTKRFDYAVDLKLLNNFFRTYYNNKNSRQEVQRGIFTLGDLGERVSETEWGVAAVAKPFEAGAKEYTFLSDEREQIRREVYSQLEYIKKVARDTTAKVRAKLSRVASESTNLFDTAHSWVSVRQTSGGGDITTTVSGIKVKANVDAFYSPPPMLDKQIKNKLSLTHLASRHALKTTWNTTYDISEQDDSTEIELQRDQFRDTTVIIDSRNRRRDRSSKKLETRLSLTKYLPHLNMQGNFGMAYYNQKADESGALKPRTLDRYALYSDLIWKLGKLDMKVGTSYTNTLRSGSRSANDEMSSQLNIFLVLRRKLF